MTLKNQVPETNRYFTSTLALVVLLLSKGFGLSAQTVSKYIVVDQFGYPSDASKIAVVRDPVTGFDAAESFIPGTSYALVNAQGQKVFSGTLQLWSGGTEDASSGDKAWWFDFSSVTTPGSYYVLDVTNNVKSYSFQIGNDVYNDVLKHAVRTFFYQRAGCEKKAQYAGEGWADAASHTQDTKARAYNDKNNAATEKDVSGGWYDAGDLNKYTNWTAGYVVQMMLAYLEKPQAWADNYNIPESGNNVPDLLDEAKWGLDHLLRMQQKDGSVLSIASLSHASPPSSATGTTYYGAVNTSAAQSTAAAFALASKVYRSIGKIAYADTLVQRAKSAWNWSAAYPDSIWKNNDSQYGSVGIGSGQQEQSDYDRSMGRLKAAIFLFDATGEAIYKTYVEANYQNAHLMQWTYAYPFENEIQEALLYYSSLPNASAAVKTSIKNTYLSAMQGGDNFAAYTGQKDPYRAHIKDYTWGSNNIKSMQGTMFYNMISYGVDASKNTDAKQAALGYIQYIHGINPLNFVYLSNMYAYGAENGVNEFFHTWFADKSPKWDRVGVSTYGPAPGFLTGGANPGYDVDGCCPSGCGSSQTNAVCTSESLTPPKGQPKQKAYKDFNTSWPLNSWSVTENSDGYQISYIRLLSKFVDPSTITGFAESPQENQRTIEIYPNPSSGVFYLKEREATLLHVSILDSRGAIQKTVHLAEGQKEIDLTDLPAGVYVAKMSFGEQVVVKLLSKK